MMELDITNFVKEACPKDYSASAAELGQNAGQITWQNAMEDSQEYNFLDSDEKREAFREFVRGSGGWTDDEISAWSNDELNALCIQWISGDLRDAGIDSGSTEDDRKEYQNLAAAGAVSSNLFKSDDKIYIVFS